MTYVNTAIAIRDELTYATASPAFTVAIMADKPKIKKIANTEVRIVTKNRKTKQNNRNSKYH